MATASMRTPSGIKGKHARVKYGTQVSVKPATFVLFVNQKRLFHFYQ
jgi:GTP-binding protein